MFFEKNWLIDYIVLLNYSFFMEKKIIIADLTEQKINYSSIECDKEGLELALFLQEGDDIVFVPVENRFINSGYLIVFNSLYDNKITYLRGNSDFFSFFFSDNISALLVKGSARKLSYISIRDDELAINSCEKLRANGINHTFEIISKGDDGVLAIGEAGEKCVYSAAVFSSDNKEYFSLSLGAVFGMKNLKAISVLKKGSEIKEDGKVKKKISKSSIAKKLRREGSAALVDMAFNYGWINSNYFDSDKDPRALHLDGFCQSKIVAASSDACKNCLISCRRNDMKGFPCPGYKECIALGSALGFYSFDKIFRFTQTCFLYGLSPYEVGLLLSSLKKCSGLPFNYPQLIDADEAEVVRIISLIGQKKGIGEVVSKGFEKEITMQGRPLLYDLRGCGIQAIFSLYGEGEASYPDLILGLTKKYDSFNVGYIAGYLRVYSHAFIKKGIPHIYPIPLLYEKLFKASINNRALLKFKLNHFSILGLKSNDLLKLGLDQMNCYDEKRKTINPIPSIFIDDIKDDGSELNFVKLISGYNLAISEISR